MVMVLVAPERGRLLGPATRSAAPRAKSKLTAEPVLRVMPPLSVRGEPAVPGPAGAMAPELVIAPETVPVPPRVPAAATETPLVSEPLTLTTPALMVRPVAGPEGFWAVGVGPAAAVFWISRVAASGWVPGGVGLVVLWGV